ncbi:toxin-antitoxin system, toxin component [Streptomyces sp. IBSBF 2390]|uniref:toxin-antitoxin system, toxin component n=1 Tax=Streptomyces sp. IBSBF 2390 TaxID=2903533 RepID=UPI002FDC6EC3
MSELASAIAGRVEVPAEPTVLFEALCSAMAERRGRPTTLGIREFPKDIAHGTTGLWLDLEDRDLVVIEENLTPDHQLVVLGHELWHMHAGHAGHGIDGGVRAARAALTAAIDWPEIVRRVAARSHSVEDDEVAAEKFGLLMGSQMRSWLLGPRAAGVQLDEVARRINAALGYPGVRG